MRFIWQTLASPVGHGLGGGIKHSPNGEKEKEVTPSPASERTEAQLLEERSRDAMTVRVEGGRKRTDIALALREEESQARLISETKVDKTLAEQPEGVRTAFIFSIEYEVFPLLANAGIPADRLSSMLLRNPQEFALAVAEARQQNPEKFGHLDRDRTTNEAFKKLSEAFKLASSALTTSLLGSELWNTVINRAASRYREARALRDTPPGLWDQTKEISKNTFDWIKTHPKQTIKIATGVAAAAIGLVWLIKKIVGKLGETSVEGTSDKKEGRFAKWMKRILLGGGVTASSVGALYVLSKIIPGGDRLRSWVDDFVKEKVKGGVSEGIEKLDKITHFSEMKNEIVSLAQKHGIPLDEWIKKMSFSEIAKDMGITSDPSTWVEYIGLGGAAILIYKWAGKKGFLINAGLYLLLLRRGKESPLGKAMLFGIKEAEEARDKILARAKQKIPGLDLVIGDALENFKLEDHVEPLLEWLKEHPAEVLLAANAAIYFRAIIGKMLMGTLRFVGKHWQASAAVGAAFWLGKKKFTKDLIEVLYDDPQSAGAQSMLRWADKILFIDRSKPDTLLERQMPTFVKSIVEDPINALRKVDVIDAWKKGDFALGIDITGAGILLVKGFSIPIQVAKLTKEALFSLPHVYSPEYEGSRAWGTALIGVETILFGSMAWEGLGAYRTIIGTADTIPGALLKGVKTLVPGTKEWRFIFRSVLEAPFVLGLKIHNTVRIFNIQRKLQAIRDLLNHPSPDFEAIGSISEKLTHHALFEDYGTARKHLVGTHFRLNVLHDLDQARDSIHSLNQAADVAKYSPELRAQKVKEMRVYVQSVDDRLKGIHVGVQGFMRRTKLLFSGKFKEAFALPEVAAELHMMEQGTIDVRGGVFKNPDGTFKTGPEMEAEATRLRSEIAGPPSDAFLKKQKMRELSAIEAFLDPTKAQKFHVNELELRALDDTARATKIEQHAAELEAIEKGTTAKFNQTVDSIVAEAKVQKLPLSHPSVTAKLEKVDADLLIPFAEKKQTYIDILNTEYKKLPSNLRTPQLQTQLRRAVEGVEGTRLTRFVKGAKGRAKMMTLVASAMFLTDQIIHRNDAERDFHQIWEELGPDLRQLLIDVLPFVGTGSNIYSAFSGKELCTTRDVSGTWDRTSNAIWGAVGLAGDIITVISFIPSGGGSLAANAVLRLTKAAKAGSKTAVKLLKMWPRIEKIAERLGGWYEFGKKAAHYMKLDSSKVIWGLRKIEKIGTIAGTTMLIGGAVSHLRYAFTNNKKEIPLADDVAPSMDEIATPRDEASPEENQGAKEKDDFIKRESPEEKSSAKAS